MIKLSVSQAARKLGVSRGQIQDQINSGKLQTHEGYVTTDSIRLAYPNASFHSEQDQHIQKMQRIQADAIYKSGAADAMIRENEKVLMGAISKLKAQLGQERLKNEHYALTFSELNEQLVALERCCHAQDKAALHQLQSWVKTKTNA